MIDISISCVHKCDLCKSSKQHSKEIKEMNPIFIINSLSIGKINLGFHEGGNCYECMIFLRILRRCGFTLSSFFMLSVCSKFYFYRVDKLIQ